MRPVYRLYIDESGDHTYGKKEKSPIFIRRGEEKYHLGDINTFPQLEKLDKRYLGLTGCIFRLDYYRESFVPTMDAFKRDFFDPDEQIILHAKDIMQRRGSFHILKNEETAKRFDAGIIDLVSNADYSIINVVIDKKNHIENFGTIAWHPYHYCLGVMLERFCLFLKAARARGDVLAESRGGSEDHELKNAYARIFTSGTRFKSGAFFEQYLTSKEIKIKPKHNNVAGLQIADILTHPIKKLTLIKHEIIQMPENDFFLAQNNRCRRAEVLSKFSRRACRWLWVSIFKMKKPVLTGFSRWPMRAIHLQQAGLITFNYTLIFYFKTK